MLSFFRHWREQGWSPITAADYRSAWQLLGGSVITHPDFVEKLSALANIPVRYLGWQANGELQAAVAVWGAILRCQRTG